MKAEAVSNAHNLLQQLEKRPELNDLAKNPLLLNIITNLHRCYPTEELPQRRSELYREIVNLQLGNRPLARKIDLALPLNEAEEVLQGLALYMVRENKPTIAEYVLLEQVREPIKNFDKSVVAKDFIRGVVDVSELLVKRDEDYEFAHLSFQGYLAAKEIIRSHGEDLLITNWEKAWWRETILLYAAQVNPNSLLKQLVNLGTKEAVALAYDCIKETPRQIELEVEKELEKIEGKVENLLYQDLETYLKNGQWKKADEETGRLMLQIGDKSNKGYLNEEDIEDFPCEDLRIINNLWVDNSQGKFGFTVQRDIWLSCGGKIGEYEWEPYKKFAVKVRWYSKGEWFNEMEYDLEAPRGHLPVCVGMYRGYGLFSWEDYQNEDRRFMRWDDYIVFFSRTKACKL